MYLVDSMRESWLNPPDYDDEPRHTCNKCNEPMNNTDGEFGEWCSFRCWHRSNIGAIKKEAIEAISSGKIDKWLNAMYPMVTDSTYYRLERAIKNRLMSKA